MRNVILVIKHEVCTLVTRPSFWVMAFVFPVFIIFLNVGVQIITMRSLRNDEIPFSEDATTGAAAPTARTGFVDGAGLILELPRDAAGARLRPFSSEEAARDAIAAGQIDRYAVIPPDYMRTGRLSIVERDLKPLDNSGAQLLEYVIACNLLGDEAKASAVTEPLRTITQHNLAPRSTQDQAGSTASYVAMGTLFVFFFLITMSSGLMLQSVSREKENRTTEMLLLSVRPRELMLGKIYGLSIVALLQMIIWVGVPMLLFGSSPQPQSEVVSTLRASIHFPRGFVLWAVPYLLLGYLMYASLMAAIGALAPNARAAGQVTSVILLPLMIPLLVNTAFAGAPGGTLATVLSLFPLTAPTAMITRLAVSPVPAWQVALSLLGLVASAYALVLLAARFFRAETLLSAATLSWGRIADELRGKP